jgi:hypothetical protein
MDGTTFFVAPFAPDGELLGVGSWQLSDLSPKWLNFCERMLRDLGPVFRVPLEHNLSHLEVKLTSTNGAGLGTFYAHGQIALSTAYLRGQDSDAELEVLRMFISSLRRVDVVKGLQRERLPFEDALTVRERPLHVVVVWGNPNVSEEDQGLIQELSNHFAGAFLCPRAS